MTSSDASGSSSLSKWHLALGLGCAVGAVGISYWYLKSGNDKKPKLKDSKTRVSIDDLTTDTASESLTPLQTAQKYKAEGNNLFKNGKYDEAIKMYNKAIEVCPKTNITDLATFYQNRAAAYNQLKKWSSVIADCTAAIELNPRYEKALMRRAKASEMIKDWESCLDDVTCVCLLQQFQNHDALMMADRVLKELGKKHASEAIKNRKPVMPSRSFVMAYFSSFSCDPVYEKLRNVDELLGQGDLKGFLKAKLAFATEKFDDIIPACSEEISSTEYESPYFYEALSLRASFYFLLGMFDEALDDLGAIINAENADVQIRVNSLIKRASIYMQTDRNKECFEDYEKAAELGPNISDVFHHRGQIQLLRERVDDARSDFDRAVALNPEFAVAYVQKCYSDYRYAAQNKNPDLLMQCLADFRKGIQKFSDCTETYIMYAQVLTEREEYEEAEAMYKKASQIDPSNATIYVHRGLLLLQWKGQVDEAVKLMNRSIEIDDKCQYAYETLGTVEVQRGNLIVAMDLFNKAINLARSEAEMVHLFSLRDAASSQLKISSRLEIDVQQSNKV